MSASRFTRYTLRTTDVDAAAAFYHAALERRVDEIVALEESAIARGARPHWLGHIGVREVGGAEAMAARFVELGAMRLGAPARAGDSIALRDPGGAIVAVTGSAAESSAGVVWHQLDTRDPSRAAASYSGLFGWSLTETLDLGDLGRHRRFAFDAGEPSVGMISDVERRPDVHTHWLFFFAVRSLDDALQRVRTHGGLVIGPLELPNGVRIAACDDAQGAAFGVIERDDAATLAKG
ncbi:MAG TPA: VOC family protein [Nannocystaceae bacterium]|nr:VOC family protein [Nannocystaceae bacterium]